MQKRFSTQDPKNEFPIAFAWLTVRLSESMSILVCLAATSTQQPWQTEIAAVNDRDVEKGRKNSPFSDEHDAFGRCENPSSRLDTQVFHSRRLSGFANQSTRHAQIHLRPLNVELSTFNRPHYSPVDDCWRKGQAPEWSRFARWMGFCCISSAFHLHFILGPRRNDGLFVSRSIARGVRGKQEEKKRVVVTITGAQLIFGAGTVTITVGGSAHSRHPPPI